MQDALSSPLDPVMAALDLLAMASESHLDDVPLASELRSWSQRLRQAPSPHSPLSQSEALALAAALHRYLDLSTPPEEDTTGGADARELAFRVQEALAGEVRADQADRVRGLYVIIDPQATRDRDPLTVAEAALRGGATALQLRDKVHDKRDQLLLARSLADLCERHDASFIVNDHADLAAACGAHGLHVGQGDLPAGVARRILRPGQFIGTSNALLEEALQAHEQGADYIAVGAMYATSSKNATRPAGVETLRRVRSRLPRAPLVAIGGITLENVDPVLEAGADGICVIGAVCLAEDPEQAARALAQRIEAARAAGRMA